MTPWYSPINDEIRRPAERVRRDGVSEFRKPGILRNPELAKDRPNISAHVRDGLARHRIVITIGRRTPGFGDDSRSVIPRMTRLMSTA